MSDTARHRFPLTMPQSLKNEVARLAKEDGVSINTWVNAAIAYRVGAEASANAFFRHLKEDSDSEAMLALLKKTHKAK